MPLSNIIHGKVTKPPIMTIYGEGGVGKSTFCAAAPSPLFICTEEGANYLDVPKTPLCRNYEEDVYNLLCELINEEHEFKTLVVDALDSLELLIWDAVCREKTTTKGKKCETIEEFGYGSGYKMALQYWEHFMGCMTRLRDEKGMAILFIAHTKVSRVEDPEGDSYDQHDLRLHNMASEMFFNKSDIVGFARLKKFIRTKEEGFGRERSVAVSDNGQRELQMAPAPAYRAKERGGMPATIPLDWASFMDAYKAAN